MWKDLSPVASECLQSHVILLSPSGQREGPPRNSERNQSCKHPWWGAEQKGYSSVVPKRGGEGWEERVE